MKRNINAYKLRRGVLALAVAATCCIGLVNANEDPNDRNEDKTSDFTKFRAPANNLPGNHDRWFSCRSNT